MRLTTVLSLRANVNIIVWDASTPALEELALAGIGSVLRTQHAHNLVVLTGRNLVRDFLAGDSPQTLTHFAIGTSATAVADAQATLATEIHRAPVTQVLKSTSSAIPKFFLSTGLLNGQTLREAGLFNAASAGTMFARVLISPAIVKTSSIAVTFQWSINLTSV